MPKKYFTSLILCLIIFFVLFSGCTDNTSLSLPTASPQENASIANDPSDSTKAGIDIVDGMDREVHLDTPAKRIVSLAPSNTEILFAVGAGSSVIGRDSFSDYPEEANSIEDVGGGYGEFDLEKIVSLKPDLVLASSLNPEELVTKLEGLDLNVFYVANPDNLEELYQNLLLVGELTGYSTETESYVNSLRARVEAVTEKTKNITERPVVFYELDGTDPAAPWTSGKGTFIDTLIDLAGGKNLGNSMDAAWAQISIEEIIAQDPDIILVGDMVVTGISLDQVKARPGWDSLTAIKNNRTHEFDDDLVSRPGPRLVDGLEALAHLLHPELFQ